MITFSWNSNNCNCDAKVPSLTSDVGIITNSTALPITALNFGGLVYDAQYGYHTLGKLVCSGKKYQEEKPSSCSSLKKAGIFHNAFYNIKEDGQFSQLVYCNMSSPGYQNVVQEFIESSESHFVEIEEIIEVCLIINSMNTVLIWLFCDLFCLFVSF